ncbi:hypothetical protein [Methanosarcina acetivorans]|uniref:hypothetical protein n=1 Tax=Methanosarcina acetivorans TaxID=2214 RepID=UPI0012FE8BF2|nr:hypothetical protein [Methanosarcina acetivorans]
MEREMPFRNGEKGRGNVLSEMDTPSEMEASSEVVGTLAELEGIDSEVGKECGSEASREGLPPDADLSVLRPCTQAKYNFLKNGFLKIDFVSFHFGKVSKKTAY